MNCNPNDSVKFQEGVMILVEYSITQRIELSDLLQFFESGFENEIQIKDGVQKQLIEYFSSFPKLANLCQLLQLDQLVYNSRDIRNQKLNKELIYSHLFQQINKFQSNEIPQTDNEDQKKYMLKILNHMVESYESFPQILCALQQTIQGKQLIFTLEPNQRFMKILKDWEASNNLKPLQYELDEFSIIQKILMNTNHLLKQEHLAYYRDQDVKKFYDQINSIDYKKYETCTIYEILIDLQNRIQNLTNLRAFMKFTRIAVAAFLLEYLNLNMVYPDLIKQLFIHRMSSHNLVLTLRTSKKFLYDISRNPKVQDLIDINYTEKVYSKLEIKYSQFTNFNNIDIVIGKMLKLIYAERELIKEHLIDLFRLEKVQELMLRVKQLDLSKNKQGSFETLLKIGQYIAQFGNIIPQIKEVVFISDNERQRAKQNIKIILQMIVEKDVVLPDLITYLTCPFNKNMLPSITLTTQVKIYNFVENNLTIQHLLQSYGVPENDGYRLLNIDPTKIHLKTTYTESVCIINILEGIQKKRYEHRKRLHRIFQQKSVIQLMKQLKKCSIQYKDSTQLQALAGYYILKNIATVFKQTNQTNSEDDST